MRYAYLEAYDVTVLKALALPIASSRDLDHARVFGMSDKETIILTLVGIALGVSVMLCIMCCCYFRLQAENSALSKDKVVGGSLRRMWERFQNVRQKRGERGRGVAYTRVPLAGRMEDDDQLDDEDIRA
jgi:hypothetical protein